MDQIQIGKFIAETRKAHGLTQRQLADALSISDKTVSKWECGKGLPEVSLLLPLCDALHITVNELLTCEKVAAADYRQKAEKNMASLLEEQEKLVREICKRGWITVILGLLVWVCVVWASKLMSDNGMYGLPQSLTAGLQGYIGILVANGAVSIRNGKKLLKK